MVASAEPLPVLEFADRRAFEDWLAARLPEDRGLWLKLAKGKTAHLTKQEAIDAALCYGWIDGQLRPFDDVSWLVRFTPRRPASKWSEVNRERALQLTADGRMQPAGLAQIDAAKADGRWDGAYAPQSRAEMPEDLKAALDSNPVAQAFFATLSGANRYAILYRIGDAKLPTSRASRIEKFVGMLERGETLH